MAIDAKNVILAILVAYTVIDLLSAFMLKRSRPILFSHLWSVTRKEKTRIAAIIIVGLLAGAGTYYLTVNGSPF